MKYMYSEAGGFNNFPDDEVENARKNGWVDGEPVRQKLMAAKLKPVAISEEPDTIKVQPDRRAGRPRKGITSLTKRDDGD